MKRRAIAVAGIVVGVMLAIYAVSYFTTSRITSVQTRDGKSLTVRLMSQPWRNVYRPIGAVEMAVRGKSFGVAYEDSKR